MRPLLLWLHDDRHVTQLKIRGVFSSFGPVKQLRIVYEQGTGVSQGKAYIEYYGVDVRTSVPSRTRARTAGRDRAAVPPVACV